VDIGMKRRPDPALRARPLDEVVADAVRRPAGGAP
jgi:hypothetical protein